MPAGEEDRQKTLFQAAETLPAAQRLKTRSRPCPFIGNNGISPRELFPGSSGFPRCPHTGARFPKGPGPQPCASDFGGRAGRPLPGSAERRPIPVPRAPNRAARAAAATRAWLSARGRPAASWFPALALPRQGPAPLLLKGPAPPVTGVEGPAWRCGPGRAGPIRSDPESPRSSRGERRFVSGNVRSCPARSK